MLLTLSIVLSLSGRPAEPWYCPLIRSAIQAFGQEYVIKKARERGYTDAQIRNARRECVHGT